MGFVGKAMNGTGIEMYYAIGAIIFISLFLVFLIRTIRMKKKDLDQYKTSIFDEEDQTNTIHTTNG